AYRRGDAKLRHGWPLLVVVSMAGISMIYGAAGLHPGYKQKGDRPRHNVWHATVYQPQFQPQWKTKEASALVHATFDELPPTAARKFVAAHPSMNVDSIYLTRDRKHFKVSESERLIRLAFLEFLAKDPRFVLQTFLYYAPRRAFYVLGPFRDPTD